MQNWTKVVSDCQKALEIDPKTVKGYFFLGQAYLELENYDEAINYLKRGMDTSFETCLVLCWDTNQSFNAIIKKQGCASLMFIRQLLWLHRTLILNTSSFT